MTRQWEYLTRYVGDVQDTKDWPDLGRDGWELVSVANHYAYFKRPVAPAWGIDAPVTRGDIEPSYLNLLDRPERAKGTEVITCDIHDEQTIAMLRRDGWEPWEIGKLSEGLAYFRRPWFPDNGKDKANL